MRGLFDFLFSLFPYFSGLAARLFGADALYLHYDWRPGTHTDVPRRPPQTAHIMTENELLLATARRAALEAGRAIMEIYDDPAADWQVERKADNSPLTLADRRAHAVIAAALAATPYPLLSEEGAHAPYEERRGWDTLWVVDPLDGTKEFIKRNGEFTVNIALVRQGVPVLGVVFAPAKGLLYWGGPDGAFRAGVDAGSVEAAGAQRLPLDGAREGRPYTVVASRSHLSPETEAFIARRRDEHGEVALRPAGSSLKICLVAEGTADVYPRLAPTMEWDTAAGDAVARAAGRGVTDVGSGAPLTYNKPDLHNPYFVVE